MDPEKIEVSPSKRYELLLSTSETKRGFWNCTHATVWRGKELVAKVYRNYPSFPFLWIEDHPNSHDYLVCGENYQGQTVIELDTNARRDFLPDEAKEGFGFCWNAYEFDRASQILAVKGCIWGAPYQYRFYDFSDPVKKWPEIVAEQPVLAESSMAPIFMPDSTIICPETSEDDDDPHPQVIATRTFRRNGPTFQLVDQWVSDGEKLRREAKR